MEPSLDALAQAMEARGMRLAVFDVGLRRETSQWYLEEALPLADILERFEEHGNFTRDNGMVMIPLHEPDTGALTDEFIRCNPDATPPTASFYDPGQEAIRTMVLSDLAGVYPAWRMRFWSPAYSLESVPPFMAEFGPATPESDSAAIENAAAAPTLEAEAFFEAVRSDLVARQEREREETRTRFTRSDPDEFIREYGGLRQLVAADRSVDEFGQQVIDLAIPEDHRLKATETLSVRDESRLHPGDEVLISAPDVDALPVEAELFAIEGDHLEFGIYWDSARGNEAERAFDPAADYRFTVGKLIDGKRYEAISEAIDTVSRTDQARNRYVGDVSPRFREDGPAIEIDLPLNQDQRRVVEQAACAEDVFCIHAPPWTGPRRVIWGIARSAVSEDRQVCVLTPDLEAADTLLQGGPDRDDPSGTSLLRLAENQGLDLVRLTPTASAGNIASADLIVAPLGATSRIDDLSVDLAIIDQAARIPVSSGAVPFAKAGRVVLLGDPRQSVPDTLSTELPASIYEHVSGATPGKATAGLRCQYRMHQAITMFPNRQFYDGRLFHGQQNRTWTIDTLDPLEAVHVEGTETTTPTGSVYNDDEIKAILDEVASLRDRGVSPEDIGILTPYSAHIGKTRVALNDLEESLGDRMTIGNLEHFQCRSREAMIISFVRSEEPATWDTMGEEGVWSPTGLNLAMTRAQKRLALIGNWELIGRREQAESEDVHARLARFLSTRGLLDLETS